MRCQETPHRQPARWLAVVAAALVSLAAILMPKPGQCAGLLIADGGFGGVLEIQEHDVKVTINNGVAVTTVTQVFQQHRKPRPVEALYTFPVPKGASVANFSMWINGKEMVGEVLEKKRAREIYESYKQTKSGSGPAGTEVDYKTFEMRIFPDRLAKAEQRVELTYYPGAGPSTTTGPPTCLSAGHRHAPGHRQPDPGQVCPQP
jgi:Ca-activated chloride channel family protein